MSTATDLCLGCGMCCDGTMFDATELAAGDNVETLQGMQAVFITDKHSKRIQQPCPAFRDGCCSIYSQRPGSCKAYSCAVLRSVEEGALGMSDAAEVVATAVALRDSVRPALAELHQALAPTVANPGLAAMAKLAPGADRPKALITECFSTMLDTVIGRVSTHPDANRLTAKHQNVLAEAQELRAMLVGSFGLQGWEKGNTLHLKYGT